MPSTIPQPSATQKFQKSIGSTMKSLFNPGTRIYFVLEHKTNSEKHRVGESSNFLSDYVEIGRGNNYAVNFGDDCKTVSRPHAAISRKENGWLLTPVSKSNATLVNGGSINSDTQLRNGDEIQLAANGPKISFLIPSNPSIKTLGFTVRFKAAMNEAVRPYKATIIVMAIFFILGISGLSFYFTTRLNAAERIAASYMSRKPQVDTITVVKKDSVTIRQVVTVSKTSTTAPSAQISDVYPYTYFIKSYKIVINDGTGEHAYEYGISGTGFLLDNGKFVTARHVIQPWLFPSGSDDSVSISVNEMVTRGGKAEVFYTAYSPDGTKINLTSDDFEFNDSKDEKKNIDIWGSTLTLTLPSDDGLDWATTTLATSGNGLAFDKKLSTSLVASTQLYVLGYPWGKGANSRIDIAPMYSECKVARDGLDNGLIDASNIGIDHGNSGGPVFIKNSSSKYIVVGIVSAERGKQGFLVPIDAIK